MGAVGRVEQSSSSPPSLDFDLLSKVEHVTDLPKESPTSVDKDLLSSSSTSPSSPSASLPSSSLLQVHSVQKKKISNQQLKVLDECMKIDPFYYDPQSFPTDEQYFQLWQVINHCRLIFSFRCYDHFTSIDV